MKKFTLFLLLVSAFAFSQEKEKEFPQDISKRHELKINALTLITVKWIDVSYEYLINEESSFGSSFTLGFGDDSDLTDLIDLKYAVTPFYRRYFSNRFARGFFVEGFGRLFSGNERFYDLAEENGEDITGFALGVSIGGKFVSKHGFTTEILLGIGRNFVNNEFVEGVGRVGISLGYRF